MTWYVEEPGECRVCCRPLYHHTSRERGYCSEHDPAPNMANGLQIGLRHRTTNGHLKHGLCRELKGGTHMRLGIDHRGRLFWRRDGERWYADPEDNDLTELVSLLKDVKPLGGSFIVGKGEIRYTTYSGQKEPSYLVLWFDPMKADWIHPLRLNAPITERDRVDTEAFIRRISS